MAPHSFFKLFKLFTLLIVFTYLDLERIISTSQCGKWEEAIRPAFAHAPAHLLSRIQLLATPWTVAHQAPLSIGFPSQEYWSVLPFLHKGILMIQGSNLHLLHWQADSLPLRHLGCSKTRCLTQRKYIAVVSVSWSSLVLFSPPV